MNSTEVRLARLRARLCRDRYFMHHGATVAERDALAGTAAAPLVGLAFVAGLACGGGAGLLLLREPLVRRALGTMAQLIEEPFHESE